MINASTFLAQFASLKTTRKEIFPNTLRHTRTQGHTLEYSHTWPNEEAAAPVKVKGGQFSPGMEWKKERYEQ